MTYAFNNLKNTLQSFKNNKFFMIGLPFLTFMVGGSFMLAEWTANRYEFAHVKPLSTTEAAKMGLVKTKKVTLESAYEEIKQLDIDNWENKRGPRPWEEATQQVNYREN